jgi:Uma2 family endonuclease
MTIEDMKKRKIEEGWTNEMLSVASGVPLGTVQKIFSGETKAPRRKTITALEEVLFPREYRSSRSLYNYPSREAWEADVLREEHAPYNVAMERQWHTVDEYYGLPDDMRVELIDGVFYDMAAPTTIHQGVAGFLYKKLLDFVMENKGPCVPFMSPVDVQLDCDDKTVIQPDVLVVCDRSKYRNGRVFGAPDLVVEVLSPSSRKKDMQIKLAKYYNAGVREYWIIDPEKKLLVQYDMEHLELPVVYNADMEIPVLIWDGTCRIDLKEMYEAISFLWETD